MKYKLSPSILAADVANLGQEIKQVSEAGADYIHIDVMDGCFVPNISFGIPIVRGLRNQVDTFFDVHLMVEEPEHLVESFATAGADSITVHLEACKDVMSVLTRIRSAGAKVGISISPDTPIEELLPYVTYVDMVLIMTVYPGKGGQHIIKETFEKIRKLRSYVTSKNILLDIEVDGGINPGNVTEVLEAGANVIVAGTKVFVGDKKENVKTFKNIFQEFEAKENAS